MAFELKTRDIRDVKVVDLQGRFVHGEPCVQVRECVKGLARNGEQKILVNLAGVDYLDSSGLGTLLECKTSVAGAGGKMHLVNAQSRVRDLLILTKLSTIFELYENEAVASLSF